MNGTTGSGLNIDSLFGSFFVKLTQILAPFFLVALMPWGAWMTVKIITFEQWKNIAPRFTEKDAQALELKMRAEAVEIYDKKFNGLEMKMDKLQCDMSELKLLLREHEAATRPK